MPSKTSAPGLNWKAGAGGRKVPYWVATKQARAAGYPTVTVNLSFLCAGSAAQSLAECDDDAAARIRARCQQLNAEAREFLEAARGGISGREATINVAYLVDLFEMHPESPVRERRADTQTFYADNGKILKRQYGTVRLEEITGLILRGWHRELRQPAVPGKPPRLRRAHAVMQTLRRVVSFGVLDNVPECIRLAAVLRALRFEQPKARKSAITYEQALAIIAKAHEIGRPSVALAQALQFELTLRQRDVIGEWVRFADRATLPPNAIVRSTTWWERGLRWENVSADLALALETSKTAAETEFDLKLYPLVIAEIERLPRESRAFGPMIRDENTSLPYDKRRFTREWRKAADLAGVPKDVWNMDSRAGGITEGRKAGAPVDDLQAHATHASSATTRRYIRGGNAEQTAKVAVLRTQFRSDHGK